MGKNTVCLVGESWNGTAWGTGRILVYCNTCRIPKHKEIQYKFIFDMLFC